jgi:catechol 2,3-dioxygenase-like lactoylglutathione lyase family enzyme
MARASLEGLTLHVSDIERSLAFYQRIPGAAVVYHAPGHFALLQIGAGRLGLLKLGYGQFHVEIEADDLEGMHAELRAAGIEPESPPQDRPWGERDFMVVDPDGYRLEFSLPPRRDGA